MPQDTARQIAHAHRVRCLFTLLYLGGLRIPEVSTNTMGQFFVRRDADGKARWWLTVHGKGGKEQLVPATQEMMTELWRYRQHLGLTALLSLNEDTPLIVPIGATDSNGGAAVRGPVTIRAACDRQSGVRQGRRQTSLARCDVRGGRRHAEKRVGSPAAAQRRIAHGSPASGPEVRARQSRKRTVVHHQPHSPYRRRPMPSGN